MAERVYEKRPLFDFMLQRVKETSQLFGLAEPEAFGKWFIDMYYLSPREVFVSGGSKDGKVDTFFTTDDGISVQHHILNSKFTKEYNKRAPRSFYDEMIAFWRAFDDKAARSGYLEKAVKPELRAPYSKLFDRFDDGAASLMFLTNCKRNDNQSDVVDNLPIRVFYLDDLIQHMVDDIDICMPRTPSMTLTGINAVLSPEKKDTEVSTSIVFARVIDFINYMRDDTYDLLFARNVRLDLGRAKPTNKAIRETFKESPKEFAFSNNGITMLCEKHTHDPGSKELRVENPRIVNGSQTLHSVRDVANPSANARVMVRIIEIPPLRGDDLSQQVARKKDVINKISIRSNQQNPIQKWNLVANDDFQLGLYRFFRRQDLFYERRDKEWNFRSRQLRSVGIKRGPTIKALAQLIASYHWDDKKLGPAVSKVGVGELFDGSAYDRIRATPPELAYQIWMVHSIVEDCHKHLVNGERYIESLRGHSKQALFALVAKVLSSAGAGWDEAEFTALLEDHYESWYEVEDRWKRLTKGCLQYIYHDYKAAARVWKRKQQEDLNFNNYFKAPALVGRMFSGGSPRPLVKLARKVLNWP